MKEHALFLQAAFPAGERECRNKAGWYREELKNTVADRAAYADLH